MKNYNFNYFDDKLPPLLSDAEFTYYYNLMKQGSKEAYNILINSNLRLVIYIAKQFINNTINNNSFNIDDLISSGTIGLMKALDSFEFEKNATFATYASKRIEKEILMVLKKNKKYKSDISLYTMVDDKKTIEETVSYEDDLEEEVIKSIFHKEIRSFILTLPDFERTVAVLYYGFDCERLFQGKIADKLGVSTWKIKETIEQIVKKGKHYLDREHFSILKKKHIENSALKQLLIFGINCIIIYLQIWRII
jgi:RNA polymerase sporulation-specific sigma factor